MKIVYITVQAPWGKRETFLLEEMLRLQDRGTDLLIIPRQPPRALFHQEAQPLLASAVWLPLINLRMIVVFFKVLLTKIFLWKVLKILSGTRGLPALLLKIWPYCPRGFLLPKGFGEKVFAISMLTGGALPLPWLMSWHNSPVFPGVLPCTGGISEKITCLRRRSAAPNL